MSSLIVDLAIAADEYLRLYEGSARDVLALARDGRRVRFPAHILRRFVTRDGIYGSFRIEFNADNSFRSVEKID